ncbi:MAG: biotin/lipoate--protein ligase family protein, partial [Gemmobacter sp.]
GPGRLDLAVVLEPDLALPGARLGYVAGMAALCEALAAHCPPERDIRIRWPDELRFDTNRLGGARLVLAPGSAEGAVPEWMVFGAELIADRDNIAVPGEYPHSISLTEEGFDDPPAIIESFAAHLMLLFDRWKHEGAEAVARAFAGRLEGGGAIGDAGDLIREGGHEALGPALARAPLWRDATGPLL